MPSSFRIMPINDRSTNSVDSSFIECEQGQKMRTSSSRMIEAQRVTSEQDRIVIVAQSQMTDNDHCRRMKRELQPFPLLQNPFGIFAVQKRPLVPYRTVEWALFRMSICASGPLRVVCAASSSAQVSTSSHGVLSRMVSDNCPQAAAFLVFGSRR